jgi:hypothetical protein
MPKNITLLFLLYILVMTGCASYTPNEKAALERAKSIKIPAAVTLVSNPSLLIPDGNIGLYKIDGQLADQLAVPDSPAFAVAPGRHTLTFVYFIGARMMVSNTAASAGRSGGISFGARTSSPFQEITVDFEPDTHYSLNNITTFNNFKYSFIPLTEASALSKVNLYLKQYSESREKKKYEQAEAQANLDSYIVFPGKTPSIWKDAGSALKTEERLNLLAIRLNI